nr:MAG TPA: peptidase [Microviridae sp.]
METVKNACRGHLFALPKVFLQKPLTKQIGKCTIQTRGDNMRAIYAETYEGKLLGAEHFTGKEFRCKDGTKEFLYCIELIEVLEKIRKHFNEPVIINSGYRTPEWNKKVGGAKNSYHMKGMAADIVVKNHSSKEVAEYASKALSELDGGVIRYTNFVHVDVREHKYRKGV